MPKELEMALKKTARKMLKAGKLHGKGTAKQKQGAYVYGTMNKLGFMHGNKRVK